MPEILRPVVDSQLASSDPLPEPPGPASGPACTGRAKVVTGHPKRLLPNACTTPAQALIDIAGLPPAHTLGRRNGMHIPSSRPARAGLRPTLKSTLQRSAPHPARGAAQPLADPVWGPALRRRVRGRRGTQAEQVPANPVRGGPPPTFTMRTFSPPAAGRACGPDLHEARRRLSAAPQRRRHTLQAKAAACWLPAGIRTPAVTSAFARREHSYRARRAAGSAEVDDQAQNVRWRNRPAATAQQCESLLDVAGQKPPGGGRRRSRLARRTFVPARH
jgi:hypothetical protein